MIGHGHNCPFCKNPIKEAKQNPAITNLVEKFLEQNPKLKRSNTDREDLDKKNIFKNGESKVIDQNNNYRNAQNRLNFAPLFGNQNNNNQGLVGGYNFNNINEDDSENSEEYSEEEALQECYECTIPGPDGHLCDNPLMGNALDNHYRCSSCNRLHPVRDIAERPVRCLICENNFCT